MATTKPPGAQPPINKIMVPKDTDVSIGCTVLGGFADSLNDEVKVINIVDLGNYLEITLNVVPWTTSNIPTGVTEYEFNTSSSLTQLTLGYTSNIVFQVGLVLNHFFQMLHLVWLTIISLFFVEIYINII